MVFHFTKLIALALFNTKMLWDYSRYFKSRHFSQDNDLDETCS